MKRFCFTLLFIAVTVATSAQLKVYSNGNVGIYRTNTSCYHPLTLGNTHISEDTYQIYGFSRILTPWKSFNIALDGNAWRNLEDASYSGRNFGVRGTAGNATPGYNYGVLGAIVFDHYGAGIYGTVGTVVGNYVDGKYAGYFEGNTKVNGLLTVTGGISGALMGRSVPIQIRTQGEDEQTETQSVGSRLQFLQAIKYRQPVNTTKKEPTIQADTVEAKGLIPVIALQSQDRSHYGFSAEQVESAFPELVYENEDGTKLINYKELIPILVESINELRAEVALLKASDETIKMTPRQISSLEAPTSVKVNTNAALSQNVPNPFSEGTTINFTLPQDSQNAFIYIFDMAGKMQKQIPVNASMHSVNINGFELTPGMYIYSLVVNAKEIDTKRMIISK